MTPIGTGVLLGLFVAGPTGAGKSRAMWMLLHRLLDRSFAWLYAVEISTRGCKRPLGMVRPNLLSRGWPASRCSTGMIWVKRIQPGAASEMLLHIVEERTMGRRPILSHKQFSLFRFRTFSLCVPKLSSRLTVRSCLLIISLTGVSLDDFPFRMTFRV